MSDSLAIQTMWYEDEDILYIEHNGMKVYPVYAVGLKLGYSEKNALEAFRRNRLFLDGKYYSLKLRRYDRTVSVPCLTGDGVLIYAARLGIERLPEDRQKKIINLVHFMAKAAMGVIEGRLIPSDVKPLIWSKERAESKSNHNLCMSYVQRYEAPRKRWRNPREPFQRESRAINEDVVGVHIRDLSNKLNASGLRVKNDAYVTDMALLQAGVPFDDRHPIIKSVLDTTYQRRHIEDLLMTTSEQERMRKRIPESQRGLSDFTAVKA